MNINVGQLLLTEFVKIFAMLSDKISTENLIFEIQKLRQELQQLKQEKEALEILLKTKTDLAVQLYDSNQKLQVELDECQRTKTELKCCLETANKEKIDLEILLDAATEHGDVMEELLHNQSIHDPLTGLFNHGYMNKCLKRELDRAQQKQQPLTIIMGDIDYFKQFNDRFGHEAGDIVLKQVSQLFQQTIRESDIACRYGGEEFIFIFPETSLDKATQLAERIRQGVCHLKIEYLGGDLDRVTISLGIACFPDHGNSSSELYKAADTALYRAKAEGRDRIIIY